MVASPLENGKSSTQVRVIVADALTEQTGMAPLPWKGARRSATV
jgi:hypothetical protein